MLTFPVSPKKAENLRQRMEELGLRESQIHEAFFWPRTTRPRGRRCQSGVELTHQPTGLCLRCAGSPSQPLNRFLARRALVERLERLQQNGAMAAQEEEAAPEESPLDHMARMFGKNFQRDIARPYPHSAEKLLGGAAFPADFMRALHRKPPTLTPRSFGGKATPS